MPYFLSTERIGFREWVDNDLKLALELWGDVEVTRFIGGPFSDEIIYQRLSREIANQMEYGISYWPIFLLETGEHIGCCGLKPYAAEKKILELGFHLRRNQWCRGYATEAAIAVIDYAFNTLKIDGLFAGHHPANTSSRRLLEKLGFKYTHDELYPPTGLQHSSYIFER